MKQKVLLFLLALYSSLWTVHADNWIDYAEEVTPETSGDYKSIYRISTPGQLAYMANLAKDNTIITKSVIVLESDIDLAGKDWTAIDFTSGKVVYVKGNNHVIKNLTFSAETAGVNKAGLFGHLEGEISDVILEDFSFTLSKATSYVGSLIAEAKNMSLVNCHVKGTIVGDLKENNSGGPNAGGLVGVLISSAMDRCSADVTQQWTGNTNRTGSNIRIGGIAGNVVNDGTIRNSYATGSITVSDKNATGSYAITSVSVGGIANMWSNSTDDMKSNIVNSFSTCSLDLTNLSNATTVNLGGFVGNLVVNTCKVSNSYFKGEIKCPSSFGGTLNKGLAAGNIATSESNALAFDNSYCVTIGDMDAIGNGTTSTAPQEIPDDLIEKLNTWLSGHTDKYYLPWQNAETPSFTFATKQAVEGTDYEWQDDVCTLKTPLGLQWFANEVTNGYNFFTGKTVMLAEGNWDISSISWVIIGNPDSNSAPQSYFAGIFDGNGQTVTFKLPESLQSRYASLFGYVKDGTIRNLTVDGDVFGKVGHASIVVAALEGGSISNVVSKGVLKAPECNNVGGIAGLVTNATLNDCRNEAEVTGKKYTGGIIGYCDVATLNNCYNSGAIQSTTTGWAYAGGLVGYLSTGSAFTKATNKPAVVINAINTGAVSAPNGYGAGGIAGIAYGSQADIYILNSGNYGKISGGQLVCGIATAQNMSTNVEIVIRNDFNEGEIAATSAKSALAVYMAAAPGDVYVEDCFYKEQVDLKALAQNGSTYDNLHYESLATIPDSKDDFLDGLNEGVDDLLTDYPDLPTPNYWKPRADNDDKLEYGVSSPVINGETPFKDETAVTITAIPNATVYYTTDNSTPTVGSTLYTSSFTLDVTTTVQAIAVVNGFTSDVVTMTFTKKASPILPPPYIPTYYNITLHPAEGAICKPRANTYVVEEGYNFSFTLDLEEGYQNSTPIVKANGIVIEPRLSDGKYVLRSVTADTDIIIEGIMKDEPTGNAEVDGIVKVQAVAGTLYIYLPQDETVRIFTASGLLYKEEKLAAGNSRMPLVRGLYFVKIAGKTYKVAI